MTQEIISVIEEKHKSKDTNPQKCTQLKKQVEHDTKEAREKWMLENGP